MAKGKWGHTGGTGGNPPKTIKVPSKGVDGGGKGSGKGKGKGKK